MSVVLGAPEHQPLIEAFCQRFDWAEVDFDLALRQFLAKVNLMKLETQVLAQTPRRRERAAFR